jgi:hypothetical protein
MSLVIIKDLMCMDMSNCKSLYLVTSENPISKYDPNAIDILFKEKYKKNKDPNDTELTEKHEKNKDPDNTELTEKHKKHAEPDNTELAEKHKKHAEPYNTELVKRHKKHADQFLDQFKVENVGNSKTEEYETGSHAQERPMKGRGQIKLFVGDTAAILAFYERFGVFPQYIVVAGAAPGTHYLKLIMLFPKSIQGHFYDTEEFDRRFYDQMESISNVIMYPKYYDEEACKKWSKFRSVLFISDIRTTGHSKAIKKIELLESGLQVLLRHPEENSKRINLLKEKISQKKIQVEDLVERDMRTQLHLFRLTEPIAAWLKWRPPWPDVKTGSWETHEDYEGLDGCVFVQPFAPPNSTEGRMLEFAENADKILAFSRDIQMEVDLERAPAQYHERVMDYDYTRKYQDMFAYINRHMRPTYDEEATNQIIEEMQRVLNIRLDKTAIKLSGEVYESPSTLPETRDARSENWRLIGDNKFVTAWKFFPTEGRRKELSKRPGCTAVDPLRVDILRLKTANENSNDFGKDYQENIIPIITEHFPFEHEHAHLKHYGFPLRNVLLVVDTRMGIYYYFDFDKNNQWQDLYCVKSKYDSQSDKNYDKRFYELLGYRYTFGQDTPDTGAGSFVTYLLLTRPYFEPELTTEENQRNFEKRYTM